MLPAQLLCVLHYPLWLPSSYPPLRLRSVENPRFSRKQRARNGAPGIFISVGGLKDHGHSGQALRKVREAWATRPFAQTARHKDGVPGLL